jgi:hypothetical protein
MITAEMKQGMYKVLKLSVQERAKFAHILIPNNYEKDDGEISSTWNVERKKRAQEIREGKVKGIPAEEMLVKLDGKYHCFMCYPCKIS